MLVRDYMTKHPLMVEPTMSIVDAQRYMGESNVRHLPVIGKGKRFLGLVTRQSLLVDPGMMGSLNVWEIARLLSKLTVQDVMVKARNVITIGQDVTIEDAARVMVEKKIGCLPVLQEGIVIGIITDTDLLEHLMMMLATHRPSVRATVRIPDVKGELAKLVAAISAQGWGILACGGTPAPKDPLKWDAVVKIDDASKEEVAAVLSQIEGQQILDVRDT